MSTPWSATALSVSPPSHQMADTDRTAFTFSAGETITTATAVLSILPGLESAAGSILSTTPGTNNAVVVVHNLTRGSRTSWRSRSPAPT